MYLFGGNTSNSDDVGTIHELDTVKMSWKLLNLKGTIYPSSRDEHTAVYYQHKMYIFGGFKRGVRTNSMLVFDFT